MEENLEEHNNSKCPIPKLMQLYEGLQRFDSEVSALTDVYLLTFLFLVDITRYRRRILSPKANPLTTAEFDDLHTKYWKIILGLVRVLPNQDPYSQTALPQDTIVEQIHHICAEYMHIAAHEQFNYRDKRRHYNRAIYSMRYVSFSLAPLTHLHFRLNDFSKDRTNP
jgi:hypothetical protein